MDTVNVPKSACEHKAHLLEQVGDACYMHLVELGVPDRLAIRALYGAEQERNVAYYELARHRVSEPLARLAAFGPEDFDDRDLLYMVLADCLITEPEARLVAYSN